MGNTNYISPSGLQPGAFPGPVGALHGMMYAKDRQAYEDSLSLQQLMQMLEGKEYMANAPVREAQRPAQISGFNLEAALNQGKLQNPNFVQQSVLGDIGGFQSRQAAGREALGTVESKIGATNTGNQKTILTNQLDQLERAIPLFQQGTMESNLVYQQMRERLSPELKNSLPPTWSPIAAQQLQRIRQHLVNTPGQEQVLDKIDAEGWWDLRRQEEANKGAQARSTARIRTTMQEFERADNAKKLGIGPMLLADPDISDVDRNKVIAGMKAAANQISIDKGTGQIDFSNINDPMSIVNKLRQRLESGGGQQPGAGGGKTPEGYDIIGQNPDGTLKIRDPKTGRTGTYKP